MKSKYRVLIVDDSSYLRQVVMKYLSMFQHSDYEWEFFEAGNGAEAETQLQEAQINQEPIDLVFLDWMMPRVSGYDFLKKIRSIEIFKKSPKIIMLTAETNSEQINAALEHKVSKYLIKPFTAEMIENAVLEAIHSENDGGVAYAI